MALNKHEISGKYDAGTVQSYVKSKVAELDQVRRYIENKSDQGAFKGSSNELSELFNALTVNIKIGVAEINQMVMTLLQSILTKDFFGLFNPMMKSAKFIAVVELLNGLFLQSMPKLIDESAMQGLQSNNIGGF